MSCSVKEYKFQLVSGETYDCSVYEFIKYGKWIASYSMPDYALVWADIDPTKENIIYPLPNLKEYQIFVDFNKNGIPTVEYAFEAPKKPMPLKSIQLHTNIKETDIPEKYYDYCYPAPLPITPVKHKNYVIYIIIGVVGAIALLLLIVLIVFLVKRYKKSS